MPPRPPVTTLVIHTWKEHGKPRPLSTQEQSTQAARDRISRSLSYDAHLAARAKPPDDDALSQPLRRPAVVRSSSVEEALLAARCSPLTASPQSTSDDDSDASFGALPLPRCISTPRGTDDAVDLTPEHEDGARGSLDKKRRPHEGLPPLPREWPLCQCRHVQRTRGIPPRAASLLLAEHLPARGNTRRARARSLGTGTPFESSLLCESMIQESSSFDAGLSDVASRGVAQSGISPNV